MSDGPSEGRSRARSADAGSAEAGESERAEVGPLQDEGVLPETGARDEEPDDSFTRAHFRRIRLDATTVPSETPRPRLSSLFSLLEHQRLILIGGRFADKRRLARLCSVEWAELQAERAREEHLEAKLEASAFELTPSTDPKDIVLAVDEVAVPSVFVLADLEPYHINRNLEGLHRAAGERHWIILTTERPDTAWQLPDELGRAWYEPCPEDLYQPGELERYLALRIERLRRQALDDGETLAEAPAIDLRETAERLETPESVERFAREWVTRLTSASPDIDVAELIALASEPSRGVARWFSQWLTPREQLVALGLSLFDQRDEDQGFAALERLMAGPWQHRDASTRFVDYGDLANLRDYLYVEDREDEVGVIAARVPDMRSSMLRAAWPTHRRQILAAVAGLVDLAHESCARRARSLELFGSSELRAQLRGTVATVLSEVGTLSQRAVQQPLLTLVADAHPEARQVAAQATALWRGRGRDSLYFETLELWRTESMHRAFIRHLIVERESGREEDVIGSAVVLALGYGALFDPPSRMHPRLIDLLGAYCASDQGSVIRCLSDSTFPLILPYHFGQLIAYLPEWIQRARADHLPSLTEFLRGLAFGLGLAHRDSPVQVSETLRQWVRLGLDEMPRRVDEAEVGEREKRLAMACLAIGSVRHARRSKSLAGLSPEESCGLLSRVLHRELHPYVRREAMRAVLFLARDHFDEIVDSLHDLAASFKSTERDDLMQVLVRLHCAQRSKQSGGDAWIVVRGYRCPIWYDEEAPPTAIHKTLLVWANSTEALSEFAADTLAEIRRTLENSEEHRRARLREERELAERASEEQRLHAQDAPSLHAVRLTRYQRWMAAVVRLGAGVSSQAVRGNLSALLRLSATEREKLLAKYQKNEQQELAKTLRRALVLCSRPVQLSLAALSILTALLVGLAIYG